MTAAALAALALAAGVAGDPAPPDPAGTEGPRSEEAAPRAFRVALLGEGGVSAANVMGTDAMAGGRVTARLGPFALAFSFDVPLAVQRADAEPGPLVLFGGGVARDRSPRLGWHAALLVGSQRIALRDYVDGGWRDVIEAAAGVRAGVEWRTPSDRPRGPGQLVLAPVVGLSATVLYVGTGSDRLRDASWGGWTALLSVTLGLEASNRDPVRP